MSGFSHVEMAPRDQSIRGQVVPSAQLLHRDVEAIGHGHQRIAALDTIEGEASYLLEGAGGTGMMSDSVEERSSPGANWLTKTISEGLTW